MKGKVILRNKKKKPLSKKHAATLRFSVADKNIATVSKKGKITAVSPGTTTVYVYAKNGLTKEVQVTVE
ncbi:MAG: Ig-like domain-containing protein [Eubacterium sp.]|nr:Ig-like domain-containing protein [Eubacterium sp.]